MEDPSYPDLTVKRYLHLYSTSLTHQDDTYYIAELSQRSAKNSTGTTTLLARRKYARPNYLQFNSYCIHMSIEQNVIILQIRTTLQLLQPVGMKNKKQSQYTMKSIQKTQQLKKKDTFLSCTQPFSTNLSISIVSGSESIIVLA